MDKSDTRIGQFAVASFEQFFSIKDDSKGTKRTTNIK
jgi:hypothetical protein